MAVGSLTTLDSAAATQTTVQQFGVNEAYQAVQEQLDAYNAQVQEMLADLVEDTTSNLDVYGNGADVGTVEELNQVGSPDAQKTTAGYNVGFPLRKYGRALQWDYDWTLITTITELNNQINAIMAADRLNVVKQVQKALYNGTNNDNYIDREVKGITLPLKALFNGDGTTPPPGPNGEQFATSHTHYLFNTTFAESYAKTLVTTVFQHRTVGTVRLSINITDEATVRAFADFIALPLPDLRIGLNTTIGMGVLDISNPGNRMIGYFNGAEVWVKPWVLASYPIALRVGAPGVKPLKFRRRMAGNGFGDLRLVYDNALYPLLARAWVREFGISVWNRDTAAVADMAHSSYNIPVFS